MSESNTYEGVVVLVIEDMTSVRKLIKNMLIQIGIRTVLEAGDGKTGLDQAIQWKPTLILCDVHMEPVDGRQFMSNLRILEERAVARIPVVFLTSDSSRDTVTFAKEHNVSGYLVKPVSLGALKLRVDAVLKSLTMR
ncbi:MAG: response regulator [Alphaproteobacteria bacterium]|nr:response regulator [Alphaproteobacteria bacterium]